MSGTTRNSATVPRASNDAIGEFLLAAVNENPRLWASLEYESGETYRIQASTFFELQEDWSWIEAQLMEAAHGTVLDVGVGAGRFAVELARSNRVTGLLGLDNSRGAVQVAKSRGLVARHGSFPTSLPCLDEYGTGWDSVLMMGNNFGLLNVNGRGAAVGLECLRPFMKREGRLIGTAGLPHLLPPRARLMSRKTWGRDGAFRARITFRDTVSEWFYYEFFDFHRFEGSARTAGWEVIRSWRASNYWGAVLAVSG